MKERLATGDKVSVIDKGSSYLGKSGKVEEIGFIPIILLSQGINKKETYIKVRLEDDIVITVSDEEKNLRKQIERLA